MIIKSVKDESKSHADTEYWTITISSDDEKEKQGLKKYNLDGEKIGINDSLLGTLVKEKEYEILQDEALEGYSSTSERLPFIDVEEARFYLVFNKVVQLD